MKLQRVCVFCGSSLGVHPAYAHAADETGRMLAQRGIELVYGGGKVGLMGRIADACLGHGGRVIGVMPRNLFEKEIGHQGLTELRVVASMHERKALMADLADAFIALPGGFGTWEEFCEVLTWSQLGLQRKACALLNVNGYYDPLLAMADRAVEHGFVRDVHRELLLSDTEPDRLLDRLTSYTVPVVDKWISPSTR
ncbi:MAG TPA: TIGR00730 family Rossman fold protein [Bryobacteraceae bacterium]|nr:TIGR00730 family Rossman fold protein [Bryobacteraceae bacterium]